jgi:hypothetical protein
MAENNRYDVIIVGSGAGGGTLAHKLAPTGKKILILERGGYVPREKDNWSPRAVNLEGKYQTKEVWHDKDGKELHPPIVATLETHHMKKSASSSNNSSPLPSPLRGEGRINFPSPCQGEGRVRVLLLLLFTLGFCSAPAFARQPIVKAVEAVGMTVSDMDRSVEFFSKVLSFAKVSDIEVAGSEYEQLQGVFGARMRIMRMKLGDELADSRRLAQ